MQIPLDKITDMMVDELSDILAKSPGKAEFHLNVRSVNNLHVNLVSRKYHVSVNHAMVNFLNDHAEDFEFKVN